MPTQSNRSGESPFRTGYILNPRLDLVWFLGLPFLAVAIALGFQMWLPYVVVASVNLWITVPHHYAGWVRSYGMPEEWARFKDRLILGPIVIFGLTAAGLTWAPITLLLMVTAWDHQHSIMQQHGFSRIYDFKAGAGTPSTGRWDLALHWTLYLNMFIQAPMFRHLWIRELHRMQIPVSAGFVETLQQVAWLALGIYLACYTVHLWRLVQNGGRINPIKYVFIAASYFLWYFAAWHTNSILIYNVAHRIMHGVQYMVMVYVFMRRKADSGVSKPGLWTRLAGRGKLKWFLLGGGAYAIGVQLMINRPLDEFGFGVVNFAPYAAIQNFNIAGLDYAASYALFAETLIAAYALTHYYVDSFIWKVRDKSVQKGL